MQSGMSRGRARHSSKPGDGDWLLEKADAISSFLAQQRSRTTSTAAKSAWGVALKQLTAESEALNKQLLQLLQQTATRTPDISLEIMELLEMHSQLAADSQTERLRNMAQVQDLSRLVHSMRCYGLSAIEQLQATVESIQQEMRWLGQDLERNLCAFAAEARELSQELAADSKAALAANTHSTDAVQANSDTPERCITGHSSAIECLNTDGYISAEAIALPAKGLESSSALAATGSTSGSDTPAGVHEEDTELQEMLINYPLAPERLKQQVLQAFDALQEQHQQQLQQLTAAAATQPGVAQKNKYGGWSADDHTLFVRLRTLAFSLVSNSRSGRSGGGKGCSKAAVLERLGLMMPGKSKRELQEHEAWYTAVTQHRQQLTDLSAAWRRQRKIFLADSEQMLHEAATAEAAAAEAAASKLAWEAAGQILHNHLDQLQEVKQRQQQDLAAQQEAEAAAMAVIIAAEQEVWQQQHAAKKEQVAQYKHAQQIQNAAAQQQAEQAAAEARAAAKAVIDAAKPAVAARQAMVWDKMQQHLEQQKQHQVEFAARQQRLAALAEALAPHVPEDPQRLLQPTASSTAAVEARQADLQNSSGAAFRPVNGYTTAQVVADPKFRVVEALREAGLTNAATKGYVKHVIAGMQPVSAARRGNMTTSEIQAMLSC